MSQSAAETGTSVEFGSKELKANAAAYVVHAAIVNAASRYDNVEDAITGLREVWKLLETQIADGAGYTPDRELGFGSDNAATIAETLTGVRNTPGVTRKQFKALGK